jgi:hypothetical protein
VVAQHTSCRSAAITFAIQNGNTANDSNACAQLTQSEADVQSATTGDQQVGSLRATITSYPDDLAPRVHQYCVPFDVVCDTNQDTVSLGNLLGEGARRGHYPWVQIGALAAMSLPDLTQPPLPKMIYPVISYSPGWADTSGMLGSSP